MQIEKQKLGMKRYIIVEDSIKKGGTCSKCNNPNPDRLFHIYLVKVIDTKTGKEEFRCNKHVRSLSRDIAHKLTDLDLPEIKKRTEKLIQNEEIKQRRKLQKIVKVDKNEVLDTIRDITAKVGNLNQTLKNSQLNGFAYMLEPSFDVLRTLGTAIKRDYYIKKESRESMLHWIMRNEVSLHLFKQYDINPNNLNSETVPADFKLTGKYPQVTGGIGAPRADLYLTTKDNQRFWIEIETKIKGIEKDVRYAEKHQDMYDKFFVCLPKDELYNKFYILWNINVKLPHSLIEVLLYDNESKEISTIVNHKELLKGMDDVWLKAQESTDKEKSKTR